MAETEARKNPLATALGTYYPRHYVVAVIDDTGRAMQAMAALQEAGFDDAAAELCPGPEYLRNYRDFVQGRNLFQRLENLFPSEEQAAVEEYVAEAERGASFLTVHAIERGPRERATAILKEHGGHAMRYYGDNAITDLG